MTKPTAWQRRDRVIPASGVSDYDGLVELSPARGFSGTIADRSAVEANCFIRRMIKYRKTPN